MFGPTFLPDGSVEFRVFAPSCSGLFLRIGDNEFEMDSDQDGFFSLRTKAVEGDDYAFVLPHGGERPDPASRYQPDGVHGRYRLIDLKHFPEAEDNWPGIDWEALIIYELHIGTFTEEGTYRAATERLSEIAELGITAIEFMPLADSAGRWNWGYDGVNLFAPRHTYGAPHELKELIDQAHRLGIAVILDVVYNHLGPEGNYLGEFGGYISQQHSTPWGDAPNFDGNHAEPLRTFILENVRYWIEDYGFDGLRVDATHCITDLSTKHIVTEIGETIRALELKLGRTLHLIAESNVYGPDLLKSLERGGHGFDGLWCDDFLHSVAAILEPDQNRSDRIYRPGEDLDLVMRRGYVFEGDFGKTPARHSEHEHPDKAPLRKLVHAIQHHDFLGNHPAGRRLHDTAGKDAHSAAAALLLLSPP
ncbi:MAG: alpha-amylase family glycosyl hydrolase, partial [Verrucomicrobiota bacterium]